MKERGRIEGRETTLQLEGETPYHEETYWYAKIYSFFFFLNVLILEIFLKEVTEKGIQLSHTSVILFLLATYSFFF